MLKKKLRKYSLYQKHIELVHKGEYRKARILYRLLWKGQVTLGLDDDSWYVQVLCENVGCRVVYSRRGTHATAYL